MDPATSDGIWKTAVVCREGKRTLWNSARGKGEEGGWYAGVARSPLVKMDGLSPYKSNGIFDRGRAGECRPRFGGGCARGGRRGGLSDGKGTTEAGGGGGGWESFKMAAIRDGLGRVRVAGEAIYQRERRILLEGCFAPDGGRYHPLSRPFRHPFTLRPLYFHLPLSFSLFPGCTSACRLFLHPSPDQHPPCPP